MLILYPTRIYLLAVLTPIDRLLEFSKALQSDDQYMTPIQVYASLKEQADSGQQLRDMLERVRGPMACSVECHGFGAVLLAEKFWEVVSHTH